MERLMRVVVMFDVPVRTKQQRKIAAKFRKELLKRGFFMVQFSVYMRVVRGITSARNHVERLKSIVPPLGNVRAFVMTEKQFDDMVLLTGSDNEQMKKSEYTEPTLF